MNNDAVNRAFERLGTPQIADAALRQQGPIRIAPFGLTGIIPGTRLAGRALPVQHFGSVDVFLEAMQSAEVGDVLVFMPGGFEISQTLPFSAMVLVSADRSGSIRKRPTH